MTVYSNESPVPPQRAGRSGQLSFPRHVVTAVLVTHDGARWLDGTLTGLFNQRRPVQQIVAVDTGSRDGSLDTIRAALGPDNVLERKRSTGYGAAVSYGLKASPPTAFDEYGYHNDGRGPVEWIWLLHDDSEPATDALLHMLAVADEDPDVAVIGPKVRGWYDRAQLLEVGITLTRNGVRWTGLERNEHDQGQHDDARTVLAVGSAGMLVRRDVWDRLKGFDSALPMFRDDVDFCWRAHAAGHRVVRAPRAIVYHAEAAARERRRVHAGVDRPHLLDRRNALYTLLVNRSRRGALLAYVRLLFTSMVRVVGLLVGKQAGRASDEFLATLAFATRIDRVLRGRRLRKRMRVVADDELADLFPPRSAVTRATYDAIVMNLRGDRANTEQSGGGRRSIESGPVSEDAESLETDDGGWLGRLMRQPALIVSVGLGVVTLLACRNLLNGGSLMGGSLLPAPAGASDLWSKFAAAWHPIGDGSAGASPPYLAVVALLSSVLFGKPDAALDVLLLGSVPLAGLSAYYAVRRVVASRLLRMWGAAAYALLPVATGAIAAGRVGVTTAMILVPLIAVGAVAAIGGPGRSGSTRSAWTVAFGLAVATAFAPATWVIAAICGLAALLTVAWRARANLVVVVMRFAIMFVSPLVVLAPWSVGLLRNPGTFLLDVGLQGDALTNPRPTALDYLFGSPGGPGVYPAWITVGVLLAALAALLRVSRRRITIAGWAMALSGYVIGLIMLHVTVVPANGDVPVVPWPGVPAAFFGFGLIVAALIGAEGARDRVGASSFGWRQPAAVLVTVLAGVAPVVAAGWWLFRGADSPITRGSPQLLPAFVSAEAQRPTTPRTLVLGIGTDGRISYGIVRGEGASLGDADLQPTSGQTAVLDALVGSLLSGAGGDQSQTLAEHDVQFVVATPAAAPQVATVLNGTAGLERRSMSGDETWEVTAPASRLLLQTSGGALTPLSATSSKTYAVTATVPAGGSGRTLLLAEGASSHWTATVDGQTLTATTANGWQQAFEVPASGGTVVVQYRDSGHTVGLYIEGALALILAVMALPTGRRDDDTEGEEEAERAAASGAPSAGAALEPEPEAAEAAPEPIEPEPAAPAEPEPAYAEAEYRGYDAQRGYGAPAYAPYGEESGYQESPYQDTGYAAPYEQQPAYDTQSYATGTYDPASYDSGSYDTSSYEPPAHDTAAYEPTGYESGSYEPGYGADPYGGDGRGYHEQQPAPGGRPRTYGAAPAAEEAYPAEQYQGYPAEAYEQPPQHYQQQDPYSAAWEDRYPPQQADEKYYGYTEDYEEGGR